MSDSSPKPSGDATPPVERDPALRMDRFVTWVLLGFGIVTVATSLAQYTNLVQTLSELYQQFGAMDASFTLKRYPDTEFATLIGQIMMTMDAGLLGFTVWWSVSRMNSNRRAIWVPVVGWLMSTVVTTILVTVALSHDPAFGPAIAELVNNIAKSAVPTASPSK